MFEAVILVLTLVSLTFLGYISHWAFHQKWSGLFFKAHMNHHLKKYPPEDFYSDTYRDAGRDNTVYLFAAIFAPIVFAMVALTAMHIVSLFLGIAIITEMLFISWLNNSLHDSFHIKNTFWEKYTFFQRLRKLHYNHHIRMDTNFGIFSFTWDKVFRTYLK